MEATGVYFWFLSLCAVTRVLRDSQEMSPSRRKKTAALGMHLEHDSVEKGRSTESLPVANEHVYIGKRKGKVATTRLCSCGSGPRPIAVLSPARLLPARYETGPEAQFCARLVTQSPFFIKSGAPSLTMSSARDKKGERKMKKKQYVRHTIAVPAVVCTALACTVVSK